MKFGQIIAALALVASAEGARLSRDRYTREWAYLPEDHEQHVPGLKGDYIRKVPSHFESESDDALMRSIIMNYALELKDPKTKQPTGVFVVDRDGAYAVAREVIGTHFKFSGEKLEAYFKEHVPEEWQKINVGGKGYVEAERIPMYLRSIVNSQELGIGLQMQVTKPTHQQ